MSTITQCAKFNCRIKKSPSSRTFKLRKNPQQCGIVHRIFYESPKKPNSGKRRVAKTRIRQYHRRDRLTARIIGQFLFPSKFYRILVRGGRGNDTPGVTYSAVRGTMDFGANMYKTKHRSQYGVKRAADSVLHIRRCKRKMGLLKKHQKAK